MRVLSKTALMAAISCGLVGVSHATVFNNFVFSGSLDSGIDYTTSGNSISFTTPDAAVGDPELGLDSRFGTLTIQYDAYGECDYDKDVIGINNTSLGAILGRGKILFTEYVFELDTFGHELGGPIGHLSETIDANSTDWSTSVLFTKAVKNVRAKKSFTLLAPDSADPSTIDLASLSLINQNLTPVPEPTALATLGLGAVALLRRRNRK